MAFFRSYIAPFLIVLIFLVAMVAVSARIVLPSDMMAPAPIDEPPLASQEVSLAPLTGTGGDSLPPAISSLIHGLPEGAV